MAHNALWQQGQGQWHHRRSLKFLSALRMLVLGKQNKFDADANTVLLCYHRAVDVQCCALIIQNSTKCGIDLDILIVLNRMLRFLMKNDTFFL